MNLAGPPEATVVDAAVVDAAAEAAAVEAGDVTRVETTAAAVDPVVAGTSEDALSEDVEEP